jgi:hypothetical protein
LRADGYFEIGDFEDPGQIFKIAILDPWSSFSVPLIQPTNRFFLNHHLKTTENELQKSGMAISKNSNRVLKVTYFEIIACPLTTTLKLKVLM